MKKFHHLFSSFLPHFDLISSIDSEKVLPISFDNEVIIVARPVPEKSFFLDISWFLDDFSGHHRPRKIDWKFRLDIIAQCLWFTQELSTEDDVSSMNAHRQNLLSLRLSFRQYSRHTTYFKWYWVCCYTNTSPRQIHLCLTWACSEPSIFCFCSVR